MIKKKVKATWTIDPEVMEAVDARAEQMSQRTGIKVSASAVVNKILRKVLVKEKGNEKES